MPQFMTTQCSKYHHPEFIVHCEHVPETDIQWLIALLEASVADGTRYTPGSSIQIGPSSVQIEQHDSGALMLLEADFNALPIVHRQQVTCSLQYLRQQLDIADSVSVKDRVDFVHFRQSIIVCDDYAHETSLVLNREPPEAAHESGWLVQHGRDPNSGYSLVSVYEFICKRPDLVKFLGLPVQHTVRIAGSHPIIVDNAAGSIPIKTGSYLDALNKNNTY